MIRRSNGGIRFVNARALARTLATHACTHARMHRYRFTITTHRDSPATELRGNARARATKKDMCMRAGVCGEMWGSLTDGTLAASGELVLDGMPLTAMQATPPPQVHMQVRMHVCTHSHRHNVGVEQRKAVRTWCS